MYYAIINGKKLLTNNLGLIKGLATINANKKNNCEDYLTVREVDVEADDTIRLMNFKRINKSKWILISR